MRTITLLIFNLLLSGYCFAQINVKDTLTSPSIRYQNEIDLLSASNENKVLFNDKMLNILFSNKIGTAFSGSNDLSLQQYFAYIDAKDESLSLGLNFDTRRGDETKKLSWVLSGGFKLKSSNSFSTVYDKDGVFQKDNIGANIKISLIGNGVINFKDSNKKRRKEAILNFRNELYKKYDDIAKEFNKVKALKPFKEKHIKAMSFDDDIVDIEKFLLKKQDSLYSKMAKEEIAYIEANKMYNYLWDHWYSFEVFAPFGKQTYKTTTDAAIALTENRFYNINATFSANTMWQFSSGKSIFLKGLFNVKNNNNILVDNLSSKAFNTTETGANNLTIVTNSDKGYISESGYEEFLTSSITIEPAFFFISKKIGNIGFSPALEFNFGKYNKTNWKLGVPISLKDKEGKPKVNFEILWKEQNTLTSSIHLVGISTSFLFGDLIN